MGVQYDGGVVLNALTGGAILLFFGGVQPLWADGPGSSAIGRPAGFVRVSVPPATQSLVALPFAPFDTAVNAVMAGQLTGAATEITADYLHKWDAATQAYASAFKAANTNDPAKDGNWFIDSTNWTPAGMTFTPGEGFFVENRQAAAQSLYLMGQLVLDDQKAVTLSSGLNLVAYPYSTRIALNSTALKSSGAFGTADLTGYPDLFTATVPSASFWLKALTNDPNDGQWLDTVANAWAELYLVPGTGYWFNRRGTGSFTWTENRPYSNLFSDTQPAIAGMSLTASGTAIRLAISCTGTAGETIAILYKDMATTTDLATGSGWQIAEAGVLSSSATSIQWDDVGAAGRPAVDQVSGRLYLVARGDLNSDADGLADAIERFVYGTDPTQADTDFDGMPDGWEVANDLNPLTVDAALDTDGDGLTNLQEYLAGIDPHDADTDGDGSDDGLEMLLGRTPLKSAISGAEQVGLSIVTAPK
ncbi:MAG: hypothetical protein WC708_10020 [Lentisphaeria bacterium]